MGEIPQVMFVYCQVSTIVMAKKHRNHLKLSDSNVSSLESVAGYWKDHQRFSFS